MIQFEKLRLQGFKSFVDKTELEIGHGLNGIVGPNGCGKSNLVEALRWVMGEGSAKKMRGDGMEDVIFAGTSNRPSKNIAEVSLLLNNESRDAPAAYNGEDEIEITRKIQRDQGSNYKINGKTVRARDVQLLLADTLTGANSPALVSQGRVTQMINAKPLERRMILEESAGIAGLYARRHEAELRLKAASANLQRVNDIVGGMEGRLNSLKRQARQASRYKNLSAQIRQQEILIAYLEWLLLEEKRKVQEEAFSKAESIVAEKMTSVTQLTKTQNTQAEDLPPLRKAETEAAAALQTQKIALQRLEDEEKRLHDLITESTEQLERTQKDHHHEQESLSENTKALERIAVEQKRILDSQAGEDEKLQKLQSDKDALEKTVDKLEAQYTALMESAAESRARQQALADQIEAHENRLSSLKARKDKALEDKNALLKESDAQGQEDHTLQTLESLQAEIEKLEDKITESRDTLKVKDESLLVLREELKAAEKTSSEFHAELSTLESFFENDGPQEISSVLDDIRTESGFEKALSRALGDSLSASLDESASRYWIKRRDLKLLPDLPEGAQGLLPHIKAPQELKPALSQIGYVDDFKAGQDLVHALQLGQSLVSKDGDYWRWDGFCMKAEAADRNALHLEQKNRLIALRKDQSGIEAALQSAEDQLGKAENERRATQEKLENLQATQAQASQKVRALEQELGMLREKRIKQESALARLDDVAAEADSEIAELETTLKEQRKLLETYDKISDGDQQARAEALKETLQESRGSYQEALRSYDRLVQEKNSRQARLQAIGDERVNLQNRVIRSTEQVKTLETRAADLKERLQGLQSRPQNFEDQKQDLLNRISALEEKRSEAAERLSVVEQDIQETNRALKEAENILGEARESRAHAHATLAALKEQTDNIVAYVHEKFEMRPHELEQHLHVTLDEKAIDNIHQHKDQKEKLVREREGIGPVNLRAEAEAQELEKEVGGLLSERNDLEAAIAELQNAIQKINEEARERLLIAFEQINAHFQKLFVQLYQGGQAHLSLIDSDDPLGAGLEIFAQPPGKSLQSLSLLSGGEQTLASIALIFAMFLTNPSPICVLDEIDAPLDDANVDRVCDLLEEIAERGETRFLIITHHRLTMARMDRLYGVTMAEKGVSKLVSVDLQQSFEFLDEAA